MVGIKKAVNKIVENAIDKATLAVEAKGSAWSKEVYTWVSEKGKLLEEILQRTGTGNGETGRTMTTAKYAIAALVAHVILELLTLRKR
jgi:hypothetical protein